MMQCWEFDPANRPSFSALVDSLSWQLEVTAEYMDIGNNLSKSTAKKGDHCVDADNESATDLGDMKNTMSSSESSEEELIESRLVPEAKTTTNETSL